MAPERKEESSVSTNYYCHLEDAEGNRLMPPLHIGQCSWGWRFALHYVPELALDSWSAWKRYLSRPGMVITRSARGDGESLTVDYMERVVLSSGMTDVERRALRFHAYGSWSHTPLPEGVNPRGPDGEPWDLITGEFC